ncbi:hypothetical protein DL96DRAFT_1590095 [Flagelloscypha sp. PMI_526]|nr:hypothetical protein DL96DRAFT_1590095 [Flagelloscypha sp. PMI_526]
MESTVRLPKLSAEKRAIAEETANTMTRCAIAAEDHFAILRRKGVNAVAAALQEYEAQYTSLPAGTLPQPDEMDSAILQCEEVLAAPCRSDVDHYRAGSAAMALSQITMYKVNNEHGNDVLLTAMGLNTQNLKGKFVVDPEDQIPRLAPGEPLHPRLLQEMGLEAPPTTHAPDTGIQYPPYMPMGSQFSLEDISTFQPPRIVTASEIGKWKENPNHLRNQLFVGEFEDYERAFKVVTYMPVEDEQIVYYIQFDGDDEAVGWSGEELFSLLEGAQFTK